MQATAVKHISQTLENVLNKPYQANLNSTKPLEDSAKKQSLPESAIASLWLDLAEVYGARFVNQYGEEDSGVWYLALHDLQEEDLQYGLEAMLRDKRFETWPPNCTQFRHLCQQQLTPGDLPNVHKAFYETVDNLNYETSRTWSHPVVKFVVREVGLRILNDGNTQYAFKVFSEMYENVCAQVATGFQVPVVSDEELVIKRRPLRLVRRPLLDYIHKEQL